jgi:hypothetical protein
MRNALLAFLEAASPKLQIELADDLLSLQHIAEANATALPMVIADVDLFANNPSALIHAINQVAPGAVCIVIVNTLAQQTESLAAGAQQALLKGFLDENLRAALTPDHPTVPQLANRFATLKENQP